MSLPVSYSPSNQIRWEKNITLGEPPGFLHSWWWWVFFCDISLHHWALYLKKIYFPCLFSLIWWIVLKSCFSGCILLNIALWAPVILHHSSPRLLLSVGCSVFWDLYCAAPERRDTCEHSSEAKAFHDYVSLMGFAVSGYWPQPLSRHAASQFLSNIFKRYILNSSKEAFTSSIHLLPLFP